LHLQNIGEIMIPAMRGSSRVLGAALAVAAFAAAAGPDGAAVLAGVQGWLDGTRNLEGRFEQKLVSGAMGTGLSESGRLYIERPGRMRWDYLAPERKVALVNGEATWLYVEEDRELFRGRLDEDSDLLATLLTGDRPLAELFDATLLADSEPGRQRLSLVPLREEQEFARIVLTVRPPGFAIEAAEVFDPAGNRMLYSFSGIKRNRRLPDGIFVFEPPPGTSISGEP